MLTCLGTDGDNEAAKVAPDAVADAAPKHGIDRLMQRDATDGSLSSSSITPYPRIERAMRKGTTTATATMTTATTTTTTTTTIMSITITTKTTTKTTITTATAMIFPNKIRTMFYEEESLRSV